MRNIIVLSGDIIASTSLTDEEKSVLELELKTLISMIENNFSIYGRIIKGDYLEMVVENPENALTVAIIIKCYIKSIFLNTTISTSRSKYFKNYGIRLAIGYGELSRYDKVNEVIDGEAIYYSGRKISEERPTYNKERIVIKNTLFFNSKDEKLNDNINCILALLDVLLNNATAKQCEILYLRLLGNSEKEIANTLNIKQPTVNKQLSSVGWNAIERSTSYFKSTFLALHKIW
ncbi:fumarate hydratase [Flavobacterium sp. SUN052]|uniref:fumarate hydratase n=1 Tax=Flavobacterium sp. SUN052 TaxID=3002441 RepID=UPI00237D9E5B|nr:fumarate hydratase [Flavobacterium sp. SUN052]MEC4005009.1 fumarate hydratase [Flavobacterium sp. SUN052]